ncbi:MAG: integrase [Planctomyces sp.]|nr:integrase [Planctomyces sp.]
MISAATKPRQRLKTYSIRPSSRPILKLLQTEDRCTPQSTLRQVYRIHIYRDLEVGEDALSDYNHVINLWEKLALDRAVGKIDREAVKDFRSRLSNQLIDKGTTRERKRSPATVNKLMRVFKALVRRMWPKDSRNPDGLGLVEYFRFPKPVSEPRNLLERFTFSRPQLSNLYNACIHAKPIKSHRHSHLYNPLLWQTALVLSLNCGPRTWDLFALKWANVDFSKYRFGAVTFTAEKTDKTQTIPLNKVAAIHLRAVKALSLDATLIFPSFKKNKTFYRCWKNICVAAQCQSMKGRNTRYEDNRKTCSTRYDDAFEGVGSWVTGHSLKGVNAKHYQDATARVRKAVYNLVQPRAFRQGAKLHLAKLKAALVKPPAAS